MTITTRQAKTLRMAHSSVIDDITMAVDSGKYSPQVGAGHKAVATRRLNAQLFGKSTTNTLLPQHTDKSTTNTLLRQHTELLQSIAKQVRDGVFSKQVGAGHKAVATRRLNAQLAA